MSIGYEIAEFYIEFVHIVGYNEIQTFDIMDI